MKLQDIRDALLAITPNTFHFHAHKQRDNYIVWAEDGQSNTAHADDHLEMQAIQGTIDYYTKTEFDPVFDQIQTKLNALDLSWKLNSIQHEDDTGYIHYEWVWEMDVYG